jgi:hypothetical protein
MGKFNNYVIVFVRIELKTIIDTNYPFDNPGVFSSDADPLFRDEFEGLVAGDANAIDVISHSIQTGGTQCQI